MGGMLCSWAVPPSAQHGVPHMGGNEGGCLPWPMQGMVHAGPLQKGVLPLRGLCDHEPVLRGLQDIGQGIRQGSNKESNRVDLSTARVLRNNGGCFPPMPSVSPMHPPCPIGLHHFWALEDIFRNDLSGATLGPGLARLPS